MHTKSFAVLILQNLICSFAFNYLTNISDFKFHYSAKLLYPLQVLSLEWSSGIENLRCISRADLNLDGSFADMILIPKPGALGRASTAALFILTNPGQLNVYDGDLLSNLKSEDGKPSQQFEKFPTVVPTIDPLLTVAKLCWLAIGSSNAFIEVLCFLFLGLEFRFVQVILELSNSYLTVLVILVLSVIVEGLCKGNWSNIFLVCWY